MRDARPPRGAPLLRAVERLGLRALQVRGFRRHHVSTDAGVVHLLDAPGTGTGPPLVVFHGLGSASADLASLLVRLRPYTRRVIAPDLPGHGWSEPVSTTGAAALQDGVFQALDVVVPEPVVVLGNSLGGLVAVRFALARPSRASGMVLMSPGGAPAAQLELEALLSTFELRDQAEALLFVDRLLARPGSRAMRWLRAWGVRHRMRRPGPRTLLQGASVEHLLSPEDLSALVAPVLVLWGQQDRILPGHHREFWREHLPPHALLEEPDGFGHSPYLDAPDPLVARIAAFLAATRS